MRTDELMAALAEIQQRWIYNRIQSNVGPNGERRRDDAPWTALLVIGDLGPQEGHECFAYEAAEGCLVEGHDNYQFVAWIDYMGRAHYLTQEAIPGGGFGGVV